jgi:hypothetical protein
MALLTLALVGVGALQWLTYNAQLAMTKTIERAWVSASLKVDILGPDTPPSVSIVFKNIGRSPAKFHLSRLVLETMDSNETLPAVPTYDVKNALPAPATLLPQQEATSVLGEGPPIGAFIYNGVINGDAHLYIHGRCEYSDLLDPTITRVTQFGWRFDARLSKKAGKAVWVFPKFPNYNDAT